LKPTGRGSSPVRKANSATGYRREPTVWSRQPSAGLEVTVSKDKMMTIIYLIAGKLPLPEIHTI